MEKYMPYLVERLGELMAIDSPSGYTANAIAYLKDEMESLGLSSPLSLCESEYSPGWF